MFSVDHQQSTLYIAYLFAYSIEVNRAINNKSDPGQLAQLEHPPERQKVAGSIPHQGTYLDCGFDVW